MELFIDFSFLTGIHTCDSVFELVTRGWLRNLHKNVKSVIMIHLNSSENSPNEAGFILDCIPPGARMT